MRVPHQRLTAIAGMLPAYRTAFLAAQGISAATPAELAARPRVVALHLIRGCPVAIVAVATYTDGEGGTFVLHANLVRESAGWEVFNVAEAPPHIPPPKPLSEGPRGC
jgi:hypothetical protein